MLKTRNNNNVIAILWMLLWVLSISTSMTIANKLSDSVSTIVIVYIRLLVATVLLLPFIWNNGGFKSLKSKYYPLHITRIILGISAMACTYYAYSRLSISVATSIGFSGPLITTMLAVFIMGDKVSARKWALIFLGYIGVIIEIRPGTIEFNPATMIEIIANILAGLTLIITKKLSSNNESPIKLLTFGNYGGLLAISIAILMASASNSISTDLLLLPVKNSEIFLLLALGITGSLSQYSRIKALQNAKVSFVAPFEYTRMILAIPIDILILNITPSMWTILGASIIIFSSFMLGLMETKQQKQ